MANSRKKAGHDKARARAYAKEMKNYLNILGPKLEKLKADIESMEKIDPGSQAHLAYWSGNTAKKKIKMLKQYYNNNVDRVYSPARSIVDFYGAKVRKSAFDN